MRWPRSRGLGLLTEQHATPSSTTNPANPANPRAMRYLRMQYQYAN